MVLDVCNLETNDGRGVFKNINIDMRQYKRLRMFIHAEETEAGGLADNELVGFIRMGNDLTENYYQIEIQQDESIISLMVVPLILFHQLEPLNVYLPSFHMHRYLVVFLFLLSV